MAYARVDPQLCSIFAMPTSPPLILPSKSRPACTRTPIACPPKHPFPSPTHARTNLRMKRHRNGGFFTGGSTPLGVSNEKNFDASPASSQLNSNAVWPLLAAAALIVLPLGSTQPTMSCLDILLSSSLTWWCERRSFVDGCGRVACLLLIILRFAWFLDSGVHHAISRHICNTRVREHVPLTPPPC